MPSRGSSSMPCQTSNFEIWKSWGVSEAGGTAQNSAAARATATETNASAKPGGAQSEEGHGGGEWGEDPQPRGPRHFQRPEGLGFKKPRPGGSQKSGDEGKPKAEHQQARGLKVGCERPGARIKQRPEHHAKNCRSDAQRKEDAKRFGSPEG